MKNKLRGIGMNQRNVPKVMDGSKTQTRRIIRNSHFFGVGGNDGPDWNNPECWGFQTEDVEFLPLIKTTKDGYFYSGRHQIGDQLYVKEALEADQTITSFSTAAKYKSDGEYVGCGDYGIRRWQSDAGKPWKNKVLPARYMPRSAARTFIEITDVRCERVQAISVEDIQAEGCLHDETPDGEEFRSQSHRDGYHKVRFKKLWNETNGQGAWERNDWVFAYTFKLIEASP